MRASDPRAFNPASSTKYSVLRTELNMTPALMYQGAYPFSRGAGYLSTACEIAD